MEEPGPLFDILGILAGIVDIGVTLVIALVDPTVTVVGRTFAFLSSIINSLELFTRTGM